MRIESIAVRHFRSLASANLPKCAGVNTLIGKNNSGKSNVLAAIDIGIGQLKLGCVTSDWPLRGRAIDEFNARQPARRIQIGFTFRIATDLGERIRQTIGAQVEGIEVALRQIKDVTLISAIVCGHLYSDRLARYVQEIAFGHIADDGGILTVSGARIFYLPDNVAEEVIALERQIDHLTRQIKGIDELGEEPVRGDKEFRRYSISRRIDDRELGQQIQKASADSADTNEFQARLGQIKAGIQDEIETLKGGSTKEQMHSFAGSVKRVPAYIPEIIKTIGSMKLLHFAEIKEPVGAAEAAQLLKLKTTRGGPAQLSIFQRTVHSLLSVSVDAFSADEVSARRGRVAEMDIDDFLVEANGAGIREALRIILDMELEKPDLVLIEEPEVHLHPGLEKAVHNYLVEKGQEQQIFLATHSTNFLDVSAGQNIYIVSRMGASTTVKEAVSENDILKIPGDIGLRPSTLFMFDILLFVEGPSDEEVLRVLASKCNIDLTTKNVGIVKMGGASNIAFFASDATIDLLSKRQIPMIFILDRDERDEREIKRLTAKLGGRAKFFALEKRELENYLLSPAAVLELIREKAKTATNSVKVPTSADEVRDALQKIATGMKDRCVDLQVRRKLLNPIYIDRVEGSNDEEKLSTAMQQVKERAATYSEDRMRIEEELNKGWEHVAVDKVPGSELLDETFKSIWIEIYEGKGCR